MRQVVFAGVMLLAMMGGSVFSKETESTDGEATSVRLELVDGSSIFGTPERESLPVQAHYGWDLDISYNWISSIVFQPETTNAIVHLKNNDRLTVEMRDSKFKMASLFGVIEVNSAHIKSITVVSGRVNLPHELRQGLLAYYPFSANEGNRVTDHSDMKRDGTVVNAEWTPDGKIGGAMRFGPEVSYVVASDAGLPMGDAPRSVVLWMKLGPSRNLSNPLMYGSPSHNQMCSLTMDWRLGRNSIGFGQHGAINVASTKFENGRWYHVVYTYGGRNDHRFFINGVEDPLAVREIGSPLGTVSSGSLYLGMVAGISSTYAFDGWLDEVMIYNRVLSPLEVRQLYERR